MEAERVVEALVPISAAFKLHVILPCPPPVSTHKEALIPGGPWYLGSSECLCFQ